MVNTRNRCSSTLSTSLLVRSYHSLLSGWILTCLAFRPTLFRRRKSSASQSLYLVLSTQPRSMLPSQLATTVGYSFADSKNIFNIQMHLQGYVPSLYCPLGRTHRLILPSMGVSILLFYATKAPRWRTRIQPLKTPSIPLSRVICTYVLIYELV